MNKIEYTGFDGTKLEIKMYYPEQWNAKDKRGLVVFFFGGGWSGGTVRQFEPQAEELSHLGMVAALPRYRVLEKDGTTAETAVKDAIYAVEYLFEHADQYGVDPMKIVLGGGSAGGHLAVSSVILKDFIPSEFLFPNCIKGLILCNPVLDTEEIAGRAKALQLSEVSPEELSPIRCIREGMPDTIIFHGTGDTTVPVTISRAYQEKAVSLGNQCKLVEYQGRNHGFFNRRLNQIRDYYDVLGHMIQFLYQLKLFELPT